ncbi:sorting nexin-16 isoform X2 [Bombus vosnesenskii]|nr:sorting nexin-16 isoform X2 [Bombus impatiens]XP_012237381.1 sorting nexin-16 isoform X2 [Bombus impatiens]XP_033183599.1 sorting nexin-16 [Bombus vancouverensis nearcticus]XP_033183600.1 sorting nexin-16 [Bombus vancouverensis nearcticus]XP_033297513.1 sorting nexin-16 isoform X2 [Bombus bifarius]XP_033297515.1 sorting nexin-16 isoform X2 [Bombus bifarius]XP_033352794.1 sorting nexin-16 isoform X2 [Bombus vosnesenskii]XP_033352795.1 sorting nexin-16 isoform X2 [Bombus vosnesenskii]XP_05
MSTSESGVGCISEVTLAISKARGSQSGTVRVLDSPDSDGSGHSNSFTVQRFNYPNNDNANSDILHPPLTSDDVRIPIVGYEVMEERARFTVYKLRVELKNGDCWFVFRRYTDFVRLLSQLRRQKIPVSQLSLPRKKWLGDNFAPSFLEERIRGLQAFVNGILSSPLLIGTACVREFFCLDEPPALSDTAEESRAIFEALEDTIYHLRQQLRERDAALAAETALCNEFRKKLHQILSERQTCQKCGASQP